jgi:hypothetical protein
LDRTVTLRELIAAVSEFANSENEVIATVVHLVNSGRVRLQGGLTGAHIDFAAASYRARLASA